MINGAKFNFIGDQDSKKQLYIQNGAAQLPFLYHMVTNVHYFNREVAWQRSRSLTTAATRLLSQQWLDETLQNLLGH